MRILRAMNAHTTQATPRRVRKSTNITLSDTAKKQGKAIAKKLGHRSLSAVVEHLIIEAHKQQAA